MSLTLAIILGCINVVIFLLGAFLGYQLGLRVAEAAFGPTVDYSESGGEKLKKSKEALEYERSIEGETLKPEYRYGENGRCRYCGMFPSKCICPPAERVEREYERIKLKPEYEQEIKNVKRYYRRL